MQVPCSSVEGGVRGLGLTGSTVDLCRGPCEDMETALVHPDRQLPLLLRVHHGQSALPPLPFRLPPSGQLTELGASLRSHSPPPFHRWGKLSYIEEEGLCQGPRQSQGLKSGLLTPSQGSSRAVPPPLPGLDRVWEDGYTRLGFEEPKFTPYLLPEGSLC